MSLINVSNLTFAYDGTYDNVFENVSFQIDSAWRLGLVARNGRGKTTLLNLLCEKYEYSGNISSSVQYEYFPYFIEDKSIDTIDILKHIYKDFELWELIRELSYLEVCDDVLYRPFNTLSNGEQTKVLLALLFLKENSFLLIDEPTNHLDIGARETVSNYLKTKKGFILVSHDRNFLDNCVDHILAINKARIEVQKGNFSSWKTNKELADNYELARNEKLKKDISRLKEASQRTAAWSDKVEKTKYATKNSGLRPDRGYIGHKAAKMMKQSKSIEARMHDAIDDKTKLLKNIETTDELKISQLAYHSKNLVSLNKVNIFYDSNCVCENISFEINATDRIALCGKNGSGKSSILKLICGEQIKYSGEVRKGSNIKISYVSQDTSFLQGKLSDFAKQRQIDQSLFYAILNKLDFTKIQFEKDMKSFSEGQKKKALIAMSLCEKAHLHIWDEPLNFIDVFCRIQIEQLLLTYRPTILFVEHDRCFIADIADKIINIDLK
ncbi:MAG: ABC-F type ribosomal protection protein [Eubacteriaceae bacterium]|nr:ABC-F type ribosomal protection protein [Eubacteriaceae bacterium]